MFIFTYVIQTDGDSFSSRTIDRRALKFPSGWDKRCKEYRLENVWTPVSLFSFTRDSAGKNGTGIVDSAAEEQLKSRSPRKRGNAMTFRVRRGVRVRPVHEATFSTGNAKNDPASYSDENPHEPFPPPRKTFDCNDVLGAFRSRSFAPIGIATRTNIVVIIKRTAAEIRVDAPRGAPRGERERPAHGRRFPETRRNRKPCFGRLGFRLFFVSAEIGSGGKKTDTETETDGTQRPGARRQNVSDG